MVLARLAVSTTRQGQGVGKGLLKDADARAFYEHYDFAPSPTDEYHLFVLVKDIKRTLGLS